ARHDARPGVDALRRTGAGLDPDHRGDVKGHRLGEPAARRLRDRRGAADACHRLWRPGRHHARPQRRAGRPPAAAGVRHCRDRLRASFLLPVRHADRGVADRILPERPDRPLTPMETAMKPRSLTASAAIVALALAGSVMAALGGEPPRAAETPFATAAAQAT